MRKRLHILGLAVLALLAFAVACGGGGGSPKPGTQPTVEIPVPTPFPGITSEVVVPNAAIPASLAFAPDGRLFYAERDTGNVRIMTPDGQVVAKPFLHVDVALGTGWGLLGLALDPDFEANGYVYIYFTKPAGDKTARPVVMRFTDTDNQGTNPVTIIDDLPEATVFGEYSVGGQMRFGPDGYLYISIGDHVLHQLAQDLDSVRGKVLRVNKEDGSPAPDNPFVNDPDADPRVFAYGFLDADYLTFQPQTGDLFVTEAGTYFCCDELNLVRKGKNYSWPEVGPTQTGVPPVHFFSFPGLAFEGSKANPAGLAFVSSSVYPALGDSLLVCEAATKYMRRLVLSANQSKVTSDDIVVGDCTLDIAASPDGTIYYSNESEIRRLVQN
jgi:glucose/arabinose dehydrogenase